ncbi:hypothetical protein CH063_15781, partial [Colletotrichum higginsianum]
MKGFLRPQGCRDLSLSLPRTGWTKAPNRGPVSQTSAVTASEMPSELKFLNLLLVGTAVVSALPFKPDTPLNPNGLSGLKAREPEKLKVDKREPEKLKVDKREKLKVDKREKLKVDKREKLKVDKREPEKLKVDKREKLKVDK